MTDTCERCGRNLVQSTGVAGSMVYLEDPKCPSTWCRLLRWVLP